VAEGWYLCVTFCIDIDVIVAYYYIPTSVKLIFPSIFVANANSFHTDQCLTYKQYSIVVITVKNITEFECVITGDYCTNRIEWVNKPSVT